MAGAAGGLLTQFLPKAPERLRQADLHPGDAPEGYTPEVIQEDDAWVEGKALISTVEDVELLDPSLSSERHQITVLVEALTVPAVHFQL